MNSKLLVQAIFDYIFQSPQSIESPLIMESVTISQKFQVVIPKKMRDALNLKPGQKVQLVQYEGRIELVPIHEIKDLRGFVKEIDTKFEREADW